MTRTKNFLVFAAALTATTFSSCTKEQIEPEMTASKTLTLANKAVPPPQSGIKMSMIETGPDSKMIHGGDNVLGKTTDFGQFASFAQMTGVNFTVDTVNGVYYTCPITDGYAFKVSTVFNKTFCNRLPQWFYATFKIVDKNTGAIIAQQVKYVPAGFCTVTTYDTGFTWIYSGNFNAGQQIQFVVNISIPTSCGTNYTSLQSLRVEETL